MAYTRLHWVESETPLSADNMNNIEDGIEELQSQKVDKVSGKALSDNNYTSEEKTKLAGIEEGAEVNVQPDWDQANTSADDYIQNKPGNATTSVAGFMSASDKSKLDGVQAGAQVNRTYTAVTGKPTAAASPAFGETVTVSQITQATTGQITATDRVITIPDSDATTSAHGLMSAADKTKLNGIASGAEVNRTYTAVTGKPTAATSLPGFGGTVTVSQVSQSTTGQVSVTDRTIKIPSSVATTSANGLMSSTDKTKLDGLHALSTGTRTKSDTVGGGSSKEYTFDLTGYLTGKTLIGVIGYKLNNSRCYLSEAYVDGSYIRANVCNTSSSSATVDLKVYYLTMSTD